MKTSEINIRDPYVLLYENNYYLYGTRSATCWLLADGFDCYVSEDLEQWEGPIEIFHRPEGFFADRFYWAPEDWTSIDGTLYLENGTPLLYEAGCERRGSFPGELK